MTMRPSEVRRSSLVGLTMKTKPTIDITLNDVQEGNVVPLYTTLDKIEGIVSISAPVDLNFDDIHITFQGASRTYVERVATTASINARSNAYHNFLRLSQPIKETDLPGDRVLKAGQTYKFPFTFVVPDKLLPQSCTHVRDNERVLDAHLQLPSSLGDPMMASDGKVLLDDLTPAMAVISYAIRVIIIRRSQEGRSKPSVLIDSVKKLRIIPAVHEAPPMPLSGTTDDDYTMRKEKELKKGLFKGKLGKLTVETIQPSSLRLPFTRSNTLTSPVTTMAVVNVRFDPLEESTKPPRLGNLVAKLKVSTIFATTALRDFPCRANSYVYDSQRGVFVESINLSSRNVESAQWTQHNTRERHNSAISISGELSSPSASKAFWTSQILVPINLPTNAKTFVPTFHSCLISRVYSLDLNLGVHAATTSVSSSTMHLRIPLQISAEGNPDARPTISEEEMQAIAARNLDAELTPRSVAPPSPEYTEHADIVRSGSIASSVTPPSPEYTEYPTLNLRTGSMARQGSLAAVMPPIPEYSEHAGIMSEMMRSTRRSDIEDRSSSELDSALPGYNALGGRAAGVRVSWDRHTSMRLEAMRV